MICKQCGNEIPNSVNFCPSCGFKNEVTNQLPTVEETQSVQMVPNQLPYNQAASNTPPPISQAANTLPPMQPTSNTLPPMPQAANIMPPIPPAPNTLPPMQPTSNTLPPMPPAPNTLPPIPASPYYQSANSAKRKKPIIPIVIISVAALIVIIGIIAVPRIIRNITESITKSYIDLDKITVTGPESNLDDWTNDINSDASGVIDDNTVTDNGIDNSNDNPYDNGETDYNYDYLYSYVELPDVMSLESDSRFVLNEFYTSEGINTYTFDFDNSRTYDEFIEAVSNYGRLIQELYGFYYEQEFSEEQSAETGADVVYLSKENTVLEITAEKATDLTTGTSDYYAYITIFFLNDKESIGGSSDIILSNYETYIAGRETSYFNLADYITMDNGISFYVNNVYYTDLGDGTASLEVDIDFGAYVNDCYTYEYDFLMLPMDVQGNILADAGTVSYILDWTGAQKELPLLMSTVSWENYTMTFIVPSDTKQFIFYGTNAMVDGLQDPLYALNLYFE